MTKGNPNGRPPSLAPREKHLHVTLSTAENDRLEEAARILDETKTRIIVRGIDKVHAEAVAMERKRQKEKPVETGEG